MSFKYDAVIALYPNVSIIDDETPYDADGNVVEINQSLVDAWVDPTAYARQRAMEYPDIGDQLDMIYRAGLGGDEFQAAIAVIKTKYPKPE
jgi:hypothetical protein